MTFEEMVAGRRETDDVSLAERYGDDAPDVPDAGFVYPSGLYISRVGPHWSEEARVAGSFHLLIANQEWIDDDLAHLERILWRAHEDELLDEPASGYGPIQQGMREGRHGVLHHPQDALVAQSDERLEIVRAQSRDPRIERDLADPP